ncbi:MAG: hypothetical protein J0J01_01875 [Reyranella sp.]|uniref:hypothetical protein n=1 Tax=Reyranella sp. TaxID=1929291 RepID=UPI001AC35B89|nr:hypothetical protein [Reyranella sp.]MBN9085631.1 hypothetical protein [Reyranella sp.]
MSPDSAFASSTTDPLYKALEERILDRDQKGASEVYYGLVKSGRPLPEMLREAVRIHAPYTHVPYHERLDDGYVNFVNNDHCLLSARASLHLSKMVPSAAAGLPLAQTIWYIPTGLDIWNQKIGKAPGHYSRAMKVEGTPPSPVVHWPDQEPLALDGPLKQRLDHWATLVHRGQVIDAYRVFLGLMEIPAERRAALAELVFAGLIDIQDRSFQNRSYTTGHKSFRARATVELGDAIGWDAAHDVLYAGALDIAVGPRWYSLYEVACNAVMVYLGGQTLHAVPYAGATELEREILANNKAPLSQPESDALLDAVLRQPEPAYLLKVTELLKAGRSARSILDALQVGAAQVVIETHNELNFSLPQHCYEYHNTLGWFWDSFEHPQRIKLLYLAAAYLNQAAHHQRLTGDLLPPRIEKPDASGLDAERIAAAVEAATLALDAPKAVGWTQAYLESGHDTAPLVRALAMACSRLGNDPHNQEIALCQLEDFGKNRNPGRGRLLLAAAQHTARHRKYGDPQDCSRRFGQALGIASLH